eukprot:8650895-Lingulodinium_polyedra.AAC.1
MAPHHRPDPLVGGRSAPASMVDLFVGAFWSGCRTIQSIWALFASAGGARRWIVGDVDTSTLWGPGGPAPEP